MDQIGQQRNRPGQNKDHDLHERRRAQQRKAQRNRLDSCTRPHDRRIDETVGMAVALAVPMVVVVTVAVRRLVLYVAERTRSPRREHVPMGSRMRVAMDAAAVSMSEIE